MGAGNRRCAHVDACRPFAFLTQFPAEAEASKALQAAKRTKWKDSLGE